MINIIQNGISCRVSLRFHSFASERCGRAEPVTELQKLRTIYRKTKSKQQHQYLYRTRKSLFLKDACFRSLCSVPALQRHLSRAHFSLLSVGMTCLGHLDTPGEISASENRGVPPFNSSHKLLCFITTAKIYF